LRGGHCDLDLDQTGARQTVDLRDPALHRGGYRSRGCGVALMSVGTILLIVLVLLLLGALPTWPHSQHWGYYPSGGLGIVLLILLVLVLSGRL
jgi:hypothetical protein